MRVSLVVVLLRGVRGSSEVTFALQNAEGRQARVYSKALVEENGKPS